MSNMLRDTIETAKDVMESAHGGAEQAAGTAMRAVRSARHGAEHVASSAQSTWWDGVKAVARVATTLRGLQVEDALGWVGLTRRRSPLLSVGVFGAGVAVGAGLSILFAPTSGVEMRRRVVSYFVERDTRNVEAAAEQADGQLQGERAEAEGMFASAQGTRAA